MAQQIPLIQIDAFADGPFEGNPAAVMPLESWLPDATLQRIAVENNLSETAFVLEGGPAESEVIGTVRPTPGAPQYRLRWFTPATEVTLCGHATLATAAYLFEEVVPEATTVWFHTLSGWLAVSRTAEATADPTHLNLTMDFPAAQLSPTPVGDRIAAALGVEVREMHQSLDLICVVDSAAEVAGLSPDFSVLAGLDQRGVIVTAPGAPASDSADAAAGFDFVSRWFGARAGVQEDPVTGSAHTQLAPFWAARLGKTTLRARQLSARGGTVDCELRGDRVLITGGYHRYLTGVATV